MTSSEMLCQVELRRARNKCRHRHEEALLDSVTFSGDPCGCNTHALRLQPSKSVSVMWSHSSLRCLEAMLAACHLLQQHAVILPHTALKLVSD